MPEAPAPEQRRRERDPEFLVELPRSVQVLQIRAAHGSVGGDG